MKNKTWSIVIACAAGGAIGAFLSTLFTNVILWRLLSVLVGGLISYLVYDLKEVAQGIKYAWKKIEGRKINPPSERTVRIKMLYGIDMSKQLLFLLGCMQGLICYVFFG